MKLSMSFFQRHVNAPSTSRTFAAGFAIAPDNARERRSDRFDQDAFHPAAEGNLTRWRFVSILAMPELTCPRCRKVFPEGMLICLACGLSLATMSDMRRACQVFRLEELAEKFAWFRVGPGYVGGRRRCRHDTWIFSDSLCCSGPQKSCALLHEAGAQSRNVVAPASGNGRPLRL